MSSTPANGRPRVLVVDDDASITAFLKRALAYEGYQVETAADGPARWRRRGTIRPTWSFWT